MLKRVEWVRMRGAGVRWEEEGGGEEAAAELRVAAGVGAEVCLAAALAAGRVEGSGLLLAGSGGEGLGLQEPAALALARASSLAEGQGLGVLLGWGGRLQQGGGGKSREGRAVGVIRGLPPGPPGPPGGKSREGRAVGVTSGSSPEGGPPGPSGGKSREGRAVGVIRGPPPPPLGPPRGEGRAVGVTRGPPPGGGGGPPGVGGGPPGPPGGGHREGRAVGVMRALPRGSLGMMSPAAAGERRRAKRASTPTEDKGGMRGRSREKQGEIGRGRGRCVDPEGLQGSDHPLSGPNQILNNFPLPYCNKYTFFCSKIDMQHGR